MPEKAIRVDKNGKGIRCAVCNNTSSFLDETYDYNKVCLSCYFKYNTKIPKYLPFEQHDLWIIKNHERNSK